MRLILPASYFIVAAEPIVGKIDKNVIQKSDGTNYRRWMSCFGTLPKVMAKLWTFINPAETLPRGAAPVHMAWTFYYMKKYDTEHGSTRGIVTKPDEKTFRKWVWLFIEASSYQEY